MSRPGRPGRGRFDKARWVGYKLCVDSKAAIREAFSRHALDYDEHFSLLETAQAMRRTVWEVAERTFPRGTRLLELGCGTGEDAVHFAHCGYRVTAIDIAPGMVAKLRSKSEALKIRESIDARVSSIEDFEPAGAAYDGLFSNFGAVNCVRSLSSLRRIAARGLKPGAPVLLVTMGRFYPLETLVFLLRGEARRAFVRLQREPRADVAGVAVPFAYYSPRQLRQALGEEFSLEQVCGLRSLLPSPPLEHVGRFLPMRVLRPLDRFLTTFGPTASFADHYISVWRRR